MARATTATHPDLSASLPQRPIIPHCLLEDIDALPVWNTTPFEGGYCRGDGSGRKPVVGISVIVTFAMTAQSAMLHTLQRRYLRNSVQQGKLQHQHPRCCLPTGPESSNRDHPSVACKDPRRLVHAVRQWWWLRGYCGRSTCSVNKWLRTSPSSAAFDECDKRQFR
jgi:hypothetical protein